MRSFSRLVFWMTLFTPVIFPGGGGGHWIFYKGAGRGMGWGEEKVIKMRARHWIFLKGARRGMGWGGEEEKAIKIWSLNLDFDREFDPRLSSTVTLMALISMKTTSVLWDGKTLRFSDILSHSRFTFLLHISRLQLLDHDYSQQRPTYPFKDLLCSSYEWLMDTR